MADSNNRKEKVAFTVLRNNLAAYLEKLEKGWEIRVMNARRGKPIVTLVSAKGKWEKRKLP